MGYNYLVAPNGNIFDGRDGKALGDDNVKGAHFCAKNSGTMGICLLGDYMTALPSNSAINSIEAIIAWKLHKENLSPLDSFMHPPGTEGATMLGTISAHRDGCNTLCNGDNYYALKGAIKDSVSAIMRTCSPIIGINEHLEHNFNIYPNPAYSEIQLSTTFKENCQVLIFNDQGIKIDELILPANKNHLKIAHLEPGLYLLRFLSAEKEFTTRLIKE